MIGLILLIGLYDEFVQETPYQTLRTPKSTSKNENMVTFNIILGWGCGTIALLLIVIVLITVGNQWKSNRCSTKMRRRFSSDPNLDITEPLNHNF